MALVNFTNLDFDQIKSQIIEYLRSNSDFSDYDFEGSNLSTIIDVLSYNTYISSYNANMLSNEVFIDSATLRENVVSLAKQIGYLPRSRRAARAAISFTVDTTGYSNDPNTITLRKGLVCTSNARFGNQSYTFAIQDDVTVPVVNGVASFSNVYVYEGSYVTAEYTVDENDPNQRFLLDNAGVDTSLIRVTVFAPGSNVGVNYRLSNNLIDVRPDSRVYFLQEIGDERYEIIFGDGIFGYKLENTSTIVITYHLSNGPDGNGVAGFTFNGRLVDNNDTVISGGISNLTTDTVSRFGTDIESTESIRKYAPKIYEAHNRAVTATDYESIIPTIFPETESISVFGGEDLDPPQFGKVFITIKPINGSYVPSSIKDNLKRTLRKYSVAGIVPEILDLKYIYVELDTTAYYNTNTSLGANDVRTKIVNNIQRYADSSDLNRYGARFKYSKFLKIVDDSDASVTSNITTVAMRRDLRVALGKYADYEICYGNAFHVKNVNGYNIKSSGFKVSGVSSFIYLTDIPNADLKTGKIVFFKLEGSSATIVRSSAGSVDYEKGEILLYPLNIIETAKFDSADSIVQISTTPKSNDVIGLQDLYLQLDINNTSVTMMADPISSGSDISGTTYQITSSYANGALVRL
jgi:hypothetical protein